MDLFGRKKKQQQQIERQQKAAAWTQENQTLLDHLNKRLADAQNIQEVGQKIAELEIIVQASRGSEILLDKHTQEITYSEPTKSYKVGNTFMAGGIVTAGLAVSAVIVAGPAAVGAGTLIYMGGGSVAMLGWLMSGKNNVKKFTPTDFIEANKEFLQAIQSIGIQAKTLIDETIRTTSLESIATSPSGTQLLKDYPTLKERFALARMAHQAGIGEDPPKLILDKPRPTPPQP